jgi:nucleotide-binding universal stress UspA family protein
MYKNILIPTDGSELAGKAVQHGVALAKAIGAKVTALTVTPLVELLVALLFFAEGIENFTAQRKRVDDRSAG